MQQVFNRLLSHTGGREKHTTATTWKLVTDTDGIADTFDENRARSWGKLNEVRSPLHYLYFVWTFTKNCVMKMWRRSPFSLGCDILISLLTSREILTENDVTNRCYFVPCEEIYCLPNCVIVCMQDFVSTVSGRMSVLYLFIQLYLGTRSIRHCTRYFDQDLLGDFVTSVGGICNVAQYLFKRVETVLSRIGDMALIPSTYTLPSQSLAWNPLNFSQMLTFRRWVIRFWKYVLVYLCIFRISWNDCIMLFSAQEMCAFFKSIFSYLFEWKRKFMCSPA